jgi:predicted transcriptional regulator
LNIKRLDDLLQELGISKVRFAKYLGVSRQMVYNYLEMDSIDKWPKEKKMKLFKLLNVKSTDEIKKIKPTADYIMEVESKLNQGVAAASVSAVNFEGFNKKEQDLLNELITAIKERLSEDKSKETFYMFKYLFNFIQAMDTNEELKYILAYVSKSTGFTDPKEFIFNKDRQFILEGILYTALLMYYNGGISKSKVAQSHEKFVQEIEHKNEERLSRTQELNTIKVLALKELGYTEITEANAKEVFEKMAEIQSRRCA